MKKQIADILFTIFLVITIILGLVISMEIFEVDYTDLGYWIILSIFLFIEWLTIKVYYKFACKKLSMSKRFSLFEFAFVMLYGIFITQAFLYGSKISLFIFSFFLFLMFLYYVYYYRYLDEPLSSKIAFLDGSMHSMKKVNSLIGKLKNDNRKRKTKKAK